MDLIVPASIKSKFRKDWGLQNVMGLDAAPLFGKSIVDQNNQNAFRQRRVRHKIATFIQTAIYPQQLTIPRQYATTREGTFIYKILSGRMVNGYKENGVRVVVQENARQARFVISPLFDSEHDARSWARQQMGAET